MENTTIASYIEKFKPFMQKTLVPSTELTISQDISGDLPAHTSKICGSFYWEKSKIKKLPKDDNGNLLPLLCQINFSECPDNALGIKSGILQFFSLGEDAFDHDAVENLSHNPDWNKIVFHDNIISGHNKLLGEEDFLEMEDFQPGYPYRVHKIEFSNAMKACPIPMQDEYDGMYFYKDYLNSLPPEQEDTIKEALSNIGETNNMGSRLGGYPFFTQRDPRDIPYDPENPWVLLLQIDSGEYIFWGDSGVANVFIKKKDLLNRNFSKFIFYWDCM